MTDSPDSDHELMKLVARGDEAAFTELVRRYQHPVYSFVYRMLNDADEADDVAQEVFIKLFRTADLYQPRAKFTTWLFAIAKNLALDRLRRRLRSPFVMEGVGDHSLSAASETADTPSDALSRAEQAGAVQRAIEQLPSDQKTALLLAEYEGLSQTEIAEVMRCSVKSVESRLYRAREFLRNKLAKWL